MSLLENLNLAATSTMVITTKEKTFFGSFYTLYKLPVKQVGTKLGCANHQLLPNTKEIARGGSCLPWLMYNPAQKLGNDLSLPFSISF